jgi:hypothetical protein
MFFSFLFLKKIKFLIASSRYFMVSPSNIELYERLKTRIAPILYIFFIFLSNLELYERMNKQLTKTYSALYYYYIYIWRYVQYLQQTILFLKQLKTEHALWDNNNIRYL